MAAVMPEFFDAAATKDVVENRVVEIDAVVEAVVETVVLVMTLPQTHEVHEASG